MPFVNFMSREINCKLVYYGPGLCGKTTNLKHIYETVNPNTRGRLISLSTETERTLFFDFLPIELGKVKGFTVRLQLYTVPGQVFYDASRKLILRGADGVVFVADSQEMREEANIESLENLEENLKEHNLDIAKIPYVVQYNKRDLPDVLPVEHLRKTLNPRGVPDHEAVAHIGTGVFETLKSVSKLVMSDLSSGALGGKR